MQSRSRARVGMNDHKAQIAEGPYLPALQGVHKDAIVLLLAEPPSTLQAGTRRLSVQKLRKRNLLDLISHFK